MPSSSYTGLFTGDIHMNNSLPHAKPASDGRTDRMLDQIKLWERFGKVFKKSNASDLWVLGDLFDHGKVDAVTLSDTAHCVAAFPGPIRLLPGNHDANTIHGGRFNLEAFGHLSDKVLYLGGYDVTPILPRPWLVFWPLEFMPIEATRKSLEDIRARIRDGVPKVHFGERMDVLLFHNAVMGCTHGGWECDDGLAPEEMCDGFDFAVGGHFHDTQVFGPDGRGMYLGAPMHHRFSDVGRRAGVWALTFKEGGEVTKAFYNGRAPRFHEAVWLDGKSEFTSDEDRNAGDYVRIKVTATHAEWSTLKPQVIAEAERLTKLGLRVSFKHTPLYHHETRIKTHDGMARASMESNVEAYADADDVDTSGLDIARLKTLGREVLSGARRK